MGLQLSLSQGLCTQHGEDVASEILTNYNSLLILKGNFVSVSGRWYREYVEGSLSSHMLLYVCVWGKSTHFCREGYPGVKH